MLKTSEGYPKVLILLSKLNFSKGRTTQSKYDDLIYYFAKHYVANFRGQTVWQQTQPGNFQNFPTMAEQMLGLQNRQCRIPEVANHVDGPDDVSHC